MGTKRYHEEVDSDVEASDASSEPSSKRTKHQDKEGTLGRSKSKKRVRTIKKQLQNDDNIPADVRMELERELAVHETAIAETAFQKKRAAMIAKYHMVRFFERKRAMRTAKSLKKRIGKATDEQEIKQLQHELHVAEVDEAYAQHFPHTETYISLYPKSRSKSKPSTDDGSADTEVGLKTERPPIWTEIEKAMKEGSQALRKIRERKPVDEQEAAGSWKTQKEDKSTSAQDGRRKPDWSDKYPPVRPPAVTPQNANKAPAMNRRERRRLMREMASKEEEEKNEGESFFE